MTRSHLARSPVRRPIAGLALFVVLGILAIVLLAASVLFQQGQDAGALAAKAEGRTVLVGALRNACEEGWWLLSHPGLIPASPELPDPGPIRVHDALRSGAAWNGEEHLEPALSRDALPGDGRVRLEPVRVLLRDSGTTDGLEQGLVEIQARGEYRHDRVVVSLMMRQVKAFWVTGAMGRRLRWGTRPLAQSVEEGR